MPSERPSAQGYIDYLDKESTLVGLLATFAVAAGALILELTLAAEKSSAAAELWSTAWVYVTFSAVFFVVAAVAFYRQRSLLAYYIGQLELASVLGRAPVEWKSSRPLTLNELLRKVNKWNTWFSYHVGWAFLAAAGVALVAAMLTTHLKFLNSWEWRFGIIGETPLCALLIAIHHHEKLKSREKKHKRRIISARSRKAIIRCIRVLKLRMNSISHCSTQKVPGP